MTNDDSNQAISSGDKINETSKMIEQKVEQEKTSDSVMSPKSDCSTKEEKTYLDIIVDFTDDTNYGFVKWFLICSIIIIFTFSFTAQNIYHGLILFGDGLVIEFSFLFSAGIIGFIFGIPKTLQNSIPASGNASTTKFITNTSLEQISDWITKIIVGLGIVELKTIPQRIGKLYTFFSLHILPHSDSINRVITIKPNNECGIFFTSLALISIAVGFLILYIYTRVNLASMFFKKSYDEEKFKKEIIANI